MRQMLAPYTGRRSRLSQRQDGRETTRQITRGDTLGARAGFFRPDGDDAGQLPDRRASRRLTRVAVMQPADQRQVRLEGCTQTPKHGKDYADHEPRSLAQLTDGSTNSTPDEVFATYNSLWRAKTPLMSMWPSRPADRPPDSSE
jgi:hypothetical protein